MGFDRQALASGVAAKPDIIAVDGGSTDSGPYYLGTGTSKYSRSTTKNEWRELMIARAEANVPLVIGTSGTCGTNSCVDWMLDMTRELAAELGQTLKVATLYSDQPAQRVKAALAAGKVTSLDPPTAVSDRLLDRCTNIVALAGVEQITRALETGADIVLAGRTTDTAIIAALPIARGDHPGGAWHGAKIGECGAFCTTDPRSGTIMVTFDASGFTVTPMAESATCTPHTVSAHMLYENANPFILFEPGGHLDVTAAQYQAMDERSVRVTGSQWHEGARYTVKLEGAVIAGYQTVSLSIVRDPAYVDQIEAWTKGIEEEVAKRLDADSRTAGADIEFRLIGKNSALGGIDTSASSPAEIGVMAIVTAQTQELANEVAKIINPYLLHHPLTPDEETPTFAFPFSPAELPRGPLYEFCLNHVMVLDDPMDAFAIEVHEVCGA